MIKSGENGTGVRRLRFGIMCRGYEFPAWEALCIRSLIEIDGVEPALLIIDDRPPERLDPKKRMLGFLDPRTLLWRVYQRAVLNRRSVSTRLVDLSAELAHVPLIRCRPLQSGKFIQRFRPDEVREIRSHNLDFVMRFAFNILRGDILESAKFGVWSFHHGDPEKYRGQPPGFWEIYQQDPVTGTALQRLTERLDSGVMIHTGHFKTDALSYVRNRDNVFLGATEWPARVCRDIQGGNAAPLSKPPSSSAAPIYYTPNSLQMLRFLGLWLKNVVFTQLNSLLRFQQWGVGVIHAPIEQVIGLVDRKSEALVRSARWLPEQRGRFLADPFAVEHRHGIKILAEDFDWKTGQGHIAAVEAGPDGNFGAPTPAIRLPYHMSYPYLFQDGPATYCVPEMHESGEVALYRADAHLRRWRRIGTLLENAPVIDPTIFQYEGRWWLFGTRKDFGDNGKLFAWYAEELTSPWQPHAANPLKTDIRSSRPAGPPFVHAGELFRPAQDCSTGYGAAIVINRITCLTPTRFEEQFVSTIFPDRTGPYPTGLHTVCGAGQWTVIDGSRETFVPAAAANAFRRKLRVLFPKLR